MRLQTMLTTVFLSIVAVLALTGSASGTTLTSPSGTVYTSTIKAESEGTTTLHNSSIGISVSCKNSTVEGKVESHGNGVTVKGGISSLTFGECLGDTVTVLKAGSLEVHATSGGNGTLTSVGAEITIKTASGVSCTYATGTGTDVGTLTGSSSTNATLDIESATIPRVGDSILCGTKGQWTGSYKFTTPSTLAVDSAIAPNGTLTSPSGTVYTGTIKAEAEATTLHNTSLGISLSCNKSTVEGKVEQHGTGVTIAGKLSSLTFTECGGSTVTVWKAGSLEVHATGGGNGTLTSVGAEITVSYGVGYNCTYATGTGTDIGTLTGSGSTNATLDIESATIPRTGDGILCGTKGQWTGSYRFTTPSTLLVDS